METAYIAGLFDGEGMVRVARLKRGNVHTTYQVQAMIGMCHQGVIERLPPLFGGSIHVNDHSKYNKNARPQHCWKVSSQKAYAFLTEIRPYLIVKADEVDLALALQEDIDKHRFKLGNRFWQHPDRLDIFQYRENVYKQLMQMKRPHLLPIRLSTHLETLNRAS